LLIRFRVMLERFRRFTKEANRDYAPMFPIRLLLRFIVMLDRIVLFAKGDNRDYVSMSPI